MNRREKQAKDRARWREEVLKVFETVKEGKSFPTPEIAARVTCSYPTTLGLLDQLEREGLVISARSKTTRFWRRTPGAF